MSVDWGSNKPGGGATGQSRRRGDVIVDDIQLTMEFEKSTPKLLEKLNRGEVIPKVEIEQTTSHGGTRATYLKYTLRNVMITAFDVNALGDDESPPTVTIANSFEEYKLTYTEYDNKGKKKGNIETKWNVKKGKK